MASVETVHDAVRAVAAVAAEPELPEVRDARTALAEAEARRHLAAEQLARLEALSHGRIAPRKELERARAEAASASAATARARRVLAAFGNEAEPPPRLGAQEGWVIARVVEVDMARVRVGSGATFVADALPGRTFTGQVDARPAYVDPASRTAPVRLRIRDPQHVLRPGMSGVAAIEVGRARRAVVVPSAAVVYDGGQPVVLVVAGSGRYVARPVDVGIVRGHRVEVRRGLRAGERVATTGAASLLSAARLVAGGHEAD